MLDKVNSKTLSNSVKHVSAGLIGAAGSGAVNAFVPAKHKRISKIAMLVGATIVAAASQTGNSKLKPTTSALLGVALRQGQELLQETLQSRFALTDNSTSSDKAIAGALGLNCPGGCQGSWQGGLPALNSPDMYDTVYEAIPEIGAGSENSFA
ncbi:hypothetical protein [Aquimarina spongiae]|uniref:Uncharacterized protein n=1 Tax=Aquimarina spongiae TaxID=570521 RepID=A0A1M6JEY9_9FLAO|nr:hypothetical protein [Aquimarina spongiae]SHJ45244.1 hypothetical protein SAMN04488508_10932 [Aquimarina spongiae]